MAKIIELQYAATTLIICPANLRSMWERYITKYDLKAIAHSKDENIDIANMRRFRLIIIDESHNLRNGTTGKRYTNIKAAIDKQDASVLLLTATPYNKDYSDLANQFRLFLSDDHDLGIRPEAYINSLGGEWSFNRRHSDIFIRSIGAFEKSASPEDWNELMKLFLIRRTRTFIKRWYAKEDPTNHRRYLEFRDGTRSYFPDRRPQSIKFPTEPGDQYSRLYSEQMVDMMGDLCLPRYGLTFYVDEAAVATASDKDKLLLDNLSKAKARMRGFCRSTFYKRLDSSGMAFLFTLYRHILRNMVYVYAIDNKLPLPIHDENELPEDHIEDANADNDIFDTDDSTKTSTQDDEITFPTDLERYRELAEIHYKEIVDKRNIKWLAPRYFGENLRKDLLTDCQTLIKMLKLCGPWDTKGDKKIEALHTLLTEKHPNEKVLIFTQYSDTAKYVSHQLELRGIDEITVVTGDTKNPTDAVDRFSPISNGKEPSTTPLRVLVSTDVLSEGQNLQDAHVIVNYDLPWAIIRLIQRAGRVDRIGQKCDHIDCYSFFPADGVENIIRLRTRLNERINQNAKLVGSDEVFFEGNEQNLRDMYNEKSGILDGDDDEEEIDSASLAYQIWEKAIKDNPELKHIIPAIPDMAYSTKEAIANGVVTFARTHNGYDVLTWLDDKGNVVSQNQRNILRAITCNDNTQALPPLEQHHLLVAKSMELVTQQSAQYRGTVTGNARSVRTRLLRKLDGYLESQPTDLYHTQEHKETLKQVIDQIYNNPLLDTAKNMLQTLLNTLTAEQLAEQVVEMSHNGILCRTTDNDYNNHEPQIVCSM